MPADNRRFSRIPIKIGAELTIGKRSFRVAEMMNLGIGGCLLPITAALKAGTACQVHILLNAPENAIRIDIAGMVKRSVPGTVAVQFTRIDPDSLFHLRNIIRHNCPDADIIDGEISRHPGIR